MKSKCLLTSISFLMSVSILFCMSLATLKAKSGAYFLDIDYAAEIPAGEADRWSFVVRNENCGTSESGEAWFFLKIFVDDQLWWNEFNDTEYKIWRCDKGSTIKLTYIVAEWNEFTPRTHKVAVELYYYYNNQSYLQDVRTFEVNVTVPMMISHLYAFSYMVLYIFSSLAFLYYYIVRKEGFKGNIFHASPVQKKDNVTATREAFKSNNIESSISLLFLAYLIQVINLVLSRYMSPVLAENLNIILYILLIGVLILFIRLRGENLRDYGFLIPKNLLAYLSLTAFLAIIYLLITVFLPGGIVSIVAFPVPPFFILISDMMSCFIVYIATESIFRGYIQTKFKQLYGFIYALLFSSVTFAFYNFPLFLNGDATLIPYKFLSAFSKGVFLGVFFQKTKTLMCPIIFLTATSFLYYFTSLKAMASEHSILLTETAAFAILIILVYILVEKRQVSESQIDIFD